MEAPIAQQIPHRLEKHGDVRNDPYYWMRDKARPEVRAYVEAENAYAAEQLAPTVELAEELFQEMKARVPADDMSAPVRYDEYEYYLRVHEGKQYQTHCRRKVGTDNEEVLLDENELAQGKDFLAVKIFEVSPDHAKIAYGIDTTGAERYVLRIKDLSTGEVLQDELHDLGTSVAWYDDNATLLYARRNETLNETYIYKHVLGTPQDQDILVYEEPSDQFGVHVIRSRSERCIFIHTQSKTATESRYVFASDTTMQPKLVYARRANVEYDVHDHGDSLYILTNDGAKRFRVLKAPIENTAATEEVIAETDRTIEGIDVFESFLALKERKNGLPSIRIYDIASGRLHDVDFPESTYGLMREANGMFANAVYRFGYWSLATPLTVVDYDVRTREWHVVKQRAVGGGYDAKHYVSKRIFAQAEDGTQIPISLVYKDDGRQGPRPMFLYGYGSYGMTIDAGFSDARISILDRGYIYAIAHIRGGGEMGREWYEEGKFLKKKHTFTDFIACAEHLLGEGYTTREQLAICGRSAGGLLIGAVVNMRPELFRFAIAEVPFVDVLTTMLDPTIPLTTYEYEEWGNPEDPTYYEYMKSYSPYDNVTAQRYPEMFIESGWNDSRVQYWEPTKWVAKLRAKKTDTHPLLLVTQMGAGHFGASGRYEMLRRYAKEFAWLISAMKRAQG